ncbi:glycyl-radical enzyme activating protein [Diplocloster hominis]|uniref:glycyl-radical enzyme activating protein n=1 Tax=Diplocloster hominis TaxID=3079010 RepID=UPI0031BB55D4
MNRQGTIFNIQRFSVQDGPGVRTLVFFKGCPLKCKWCCNPESRDPKPDILFHGTKCLECGRCIANCPNGAIRTETKAKVIDRQACTLCMECVKKCYAGALESVGEEKNAEEIMEEILKDQLIYENSHGGVTVSGGEPAMQADFAAAILKACKENGIHTAMETCGYAKYSEYEKLLPWLDLALFDLKHMDPDVHKKVTGVSNEQILDNMERLCRANVEVIARLPLIPGINTGKENIHKVGTFCQKLHIAQAHMLPYHKLGVNKYESLGIAYPLPETGAVSDGELEEIQEILESYGLKITVYNHS